MKKEKIKFIHDSLGESKDFSKEVRRYLYEIEKQIPLTDIEKELWEKTHIIHITGVIQGIKYRRSSCERVSRNILQSCKRRLKPSKIIQ